MSTNKIQWVSIKSDFDGELLVFIRRDNLKLVFCPTYRPSPASAKRILKIAEELAGKYEISLSFSKIINKLDMLIFLSLPRTSPML